MPASKNLFYARASWTIPPTEAPGVIKMEMAEIPLRVATILCALVLNKPQSNKPAKEECRWGLHSPICTKSTADPKEEGTEDWNNERQENQQRNHYPLNPQYPPVYDIHDRFSQQNKLEKQWNERMECLNKKYNSDYYSSSKFDSHYGSEHKFETLI